MIVVGDATLDADGTALQGIVIQAGQTSGYTVLTATEDDDDYEDETVTVAYSGTGIGQSDQIVISVTDNDEAPEPPVVEPTVKEKSSEDVQAILDGEVGSGFTPGSSVTFNIGNLFEQFGADVDPVFAVTPGDEMIVTGVVSGHDVTLTAGMAGSTSLSVTVTDRESGDSATAMGYVTVTLADMTVTVTADPMEIMEGGETVLYVTASREVTASDGLVQVRWSIIGDATIDDDQTTIAVATARPTRRLWCPRTMRSTKRARR